MVGGSFVLTPATAIRYEKHDRRVQQISREEALGLSKDKRKAFDINEEYYRLAAKVSCGGDAVHAVHRLKYTRLFRNRDEVLMDETLVGFG